MLTECLRREDCCMLDNYYVNEAALRIEHKAPPPPQAPYNSGNWRAALYTTGPIIVSCSQRNVCVHWIIRTGILFSIKGLSGMKAELNLT